MVRTVIGKGFLLRIAPTGRTALVCVFEADDVVYVNEVSGFVCVKAYGGIGFVTAVAEVFAVIAVCNDN
jgi:hypothetical protein